MFLKHIYVFTVALCFNSYFGVLNVCFVFLIILVFLVCDYYFVFKLFVLDGIVQSTLCLWYVAVLIVFVGAHTRYSE